MRRLDRACGDTEVQHRPVQHEPRRAGSRVVDSNRPLGVRPVDVRAVIELHVHEVLGAMRPAARIPHQAAVDRRCRSAADEGFGRGILVGVVVHADGAARLARRPPNGVARVRGFESRELDALDVERRRVRELVRIDAEALDSREGAGARRPSHLPRASGVDRDRRHVEVQLVDDVRAGTAVERDPPAVGFLHFARDVPHHAHDGPVTQIACLVRQSDFGGEDAVLRRIDVVERAAHVSMQRIDDRLGKLRAWTRVREVADRARAEESDDASERRARLGLGVRDRGDSGARQIDRVVDVGRARHVPRIVQVRGRELVGTALFRRRQ